MGEEEAWEKIFWEEALRGSNEEEEEARRSKEMDMEWSELLRGRG